MFEKFLWFLEELPQSVGKILNAHLYDDGYATIEIENRHGQKCQITFTKETEEKEND